jgi:hypothetical protein
MSFVCACYWVPRRPSHFGCMSPRVRRSENAKDVPLAIYGATTSSGAGEVIEYCLFLSPFGADANLGIRCS